MNTKNIFAKLIFLLPLFVQAGANEMKWGKIPDMDLQMTKDPQNSGAIVLGDYGVVSFDAYHDGTFSMYFARHVRIKILSAAGYKWADVEIPYDSEDNFERIDDLEAQCIILNEDGSTSAFKVEKKNIIEEVVYRFHHKIRFSFPHVQDGAVIEYRYRIISKNFWIKPWNFQSTIPTRVSCLTTRIPSILEYAVIPKGERAIIDRSAEVYIQQVHIGSSAESVRLTGTLTTYTAKNLPAFIEEDYMTSPADYLMRYLFQLRGVQIPGDVKRNSITTWNELTTKLIQSHYFGEQLNGNAFLKENTSQLLSGVSNEDTAAKVKAIFRHVQGTIQFSGFQALWCSDNLKKVYEQKNGSGTDMNFILLLMLRNAGISAHPVAISTRDHGRIQKFTPVYDQFNHVIVCANVASKCWLLDASDPLAHPGILPADDLNGSGLLIYDNGENEWISLESAKGARKFMFCNGQLDDQGNLNARMETTYDGYFAIDTRDRVNQVGRDNFIKKSIESVVPDINILESELLQLDSLELPLKTRVDYGTSHFSSMTGDVCYFKPMQYAVLENPFRNPNRDFDVDFNYPREITYMLNLTIPKGFSVTEFPAPVKYVMPDNSVQFIYNATVSEGRIQIMSKLSISRVIYGPEEYEYLREMFNQVITKQGEQIVLKKT